MPTIFCLGSLNIDEVLTVPHIVQEGETLACTAIQHIAGGKGANQSVALAQAGSNVMHVGRIGTDGKWLLDQLEAKNVQCNVAIDSTALTGRAIIQVSSATHDNCIVLVPGANHRISKEQVCQVADKIKKGDWVVMQNEINIDAARLFMELAAQKDATIVLNPAPCVPGIASLFPFHLLSALILNETELSLYTTGRVSQLQTRDEMNEQLRAALQSNPDMSLIILTLGSEGAQVVFRKEDGSIVEFSTGVTRKVNVVDTTAAGDTFVGYLVSFLSSQNQPIKKIPEDIIRKAIAWAVLASGLACETKGAIPSIPSKAKVESLMS